MAPHRPLPLPLCQGKPYLHLVIDLQDELQEGTKQSRAKGNQIFLIKTFCRSRFLKTCKYVTFSFSQIGFPDLPSVFRLKVYFKKPE